MPLEFRQRSSRRLEDNTGLSLGPAGVAAAAAALVLAACAASPGVAPRPSRATPPPVVEAPSAVVEAALVQRGGGTGPEILLPAGDSDDDVVVRSGGLVVHKRHVFDRLLEEEPGGVRVLLERMQLDAIVARAAREWGIEVQPDEIEALVSASERTLRDEVQSEFGGRVTFAGYLDRRWGMNEQEYHRWLTVSRVREFYRGYALRYAALREDRVEVRYIVHSDLDLLTELAARVRQGADFATLAIRHTEGANRLDGGKLPAFGRGFEHPVADVAFLLEPGQVSDVFEREIDGSKRYYLVYCLARIPGRDVPFAQVKEELRADILARDLSPAEFAAASTQLRQAMRALQPSGAPR